MITATANLVKCSAPLTVARLGSHAPETRPPSVPGVLKWSGEIPSQKWMNFYTKVLSKFANSKGLKLTVSFEVAPEGGLSSQKIEETKAGLQELGLDSDVETT